MLAGVKGWFSALSLLGKVGVITGLSVVSLGTVGAINGPQPTKTQSPHQVQAAKQTCISSKTTTTETQTIPFDKTTVNDPNTAQGKTYIKTPGVNGVKTITYDVTTYNPSGCQQNAKTQLKEEVTTQPVTEVIGVGTYVAPSCPNGLYTNVDGVVVCSPSATNAGGATARCVDGTYSYSLNHSGTCSHHGGVAEWL